jgi:hypothetical protein
LHTRWNAGINFINVLRERFSFKILVPKIAKLCFGVEIFWRQNFVQKCARTMLMKLTAVGLPAFPSSDFFGQKASENIDKFEFDEKQISKAFTFIDILYFLTLVVVRMRHGIDSFG